MKIESLEALENYSKIYSNSKETAKTFIAHDCCLIMNAYDKSIVDNIYLVFNSNRTLHTIVEENDDCYKLLIDNPCTFKLAI